MRIRIVEYSDATVHGDMRDPKCAFGAIKNRCEINRAFQKILNFTQM